MPSMTKEERIEYNKKYYNDNKKIIIEKASQKITCNLCKRIVIKNSYDKHLKSKLCVNTQNKNKYIQDRLLIN